VTFVLVGESSRERMELSLPGANVLGIESSIIQADEIGGDGSLRVRSWA